VNRFRKLAYAVLASGTIAGVMFFAVQHFTIFPLIEKAEVYESAAEKTAPHHHEDEGFVEKKSKIKYFFVFAVDLKRVLKRV
jgi:predicted cobalt transporter CbtA